MRKFMISICILISITTVGCKDTVVLEENIGVDNTVEEYDIKEVPIDLKGYFTFMNYENNEVIGMGYNVESEKEISIPLDELNDKYLSINDENNEINSIYDDIALNSEGLTMNDEWDYYGITNEVEKDI